MRIVRYSYPTSRAQSPFFTSQPRLFGGLETEINRLFNAALSDSETTQNRRFPVDLYEDADNTFVRAELPGVDRAAIQVEHADGRLTINATRKTGAPGAEETETFNRSVSVPDTLVDADKITAVYENGVLTVTLPKRAETKPRKVSVSVN